MTSPDLTFRISAEFGEVKQALAALKQQIATLGSGLSSGSATGPVDSVAAAARQAEAAAKRAADAEIREARRAAAGKTDAAKQGEAAKAAAADRERRKAEASAERARRQQAATEEAERRKKAAADKKAADDASRAKAKTENFALNQNRQLAPQITDITVGLATGQSPLMVLLQQGGQLKDLFGGIVPAAKAVGSAFAAMVTPITATVAGVLALAVAYSKGQDETLRFNRLIIETGNSAGVTTDGLVDMARQMDQTFGVTMSSASDALAQVVQAGKFSQSQIQTIATTADNLRNVTGKAVGETIAEFAKIADDPVKGAVELNRQYNFLTGSTLAQIRALQQQGRTQDAANLATKAYADALKQRTPEIEKNLGLIERGWLAIKRGAGEAASAALSIGRRQTDRDQFNNLFQERQRLQDELASSGGGLGASLNPELRKAGAKKRERLEQITKEMTDLADAEVKALKDANAKAAQGRAVALQDAVTTEADQYLTAGQRRKKAIEAITNRTSQGIADAQIAGDATAAAEVERARAAILDGLGREAAKSQAAVVSIDAGLVRDSTDRALLELDRLYDNGEIKLSDFLDRKAALQRQAIDAELRAAKAERGAVIEPEDVARVNAQIVKLERQRANIGKDIAFERRNQEKQVSGEIVAIRAQQLEDEGRLEEAAALRFAEQYRDLRKRLKGNQAGLDILDALNAAQQKNIRQQTGDQVVELKARQLETEGRLEQAAILRSEAQYRDLRKRLARDAESLKLIDKIVDIDRAKARFGELQNEAEKVFAELQRRQTATADSVRAGTITPGQGEAEDEVSRQQAIASLQSLNAEMLRLADTTKDPAIIEAAARIRDSIRSIGQDGKPALEKVREELRATLADMEKNFARASANAGVDALTTLFTDLASGSKSAGDAIKDFARSFVASMAQIAARALATMLVLKALEAITGIPAQLLGQAATVGANVKHGGGMAGHGTRRQVDPLVFAAAPRFHDGSGVLGLKPGEIPAILQDGERVQSRDEVRAGGGQGGGNGYRIVNVLDPNLVTAHLESAAGERAILNVISRNPAQVRQIIDN